MKLMDSKVSNIIGAIALSFSIFAVILLVPAIANNKVLLWFIDIACIFTLAMFMVNKNMARRNWNNKYVSTKWGTVIFGFLLLSVALLIPVLRENENFLSNAVYYIDDNTSHSNYPSEYQYSPSYSSTNGFYRNSCYSGYEAVSNVSIGYRGRVHCKPKPGCYGPNAGRGNRAGCACRSNAGNSAGGLSCTSGLSCMVDSGEFEGRDLSFVPEEFKGSFPCRNRACTERYVGFIPNASSPSSSEWDVYWYIRKENGSWKYAGRGKANTYQGSCARKPSVTSGLSGSNTKNYGNCKAPYKTSKCQNIKTQACNGGAYLKGYCPNYGSNIRCCVHGYVE